METIDMTPTWQGILPYYLAVLQDGNDKGQGIAKAELLNMAKAADAYNKLIKAQKNHRDHGKGTTKTNTR